MKQELRIYKNNLNSQSLGIFVYETGIENLLKTFQISIIKFLNATWSRWLSTEDLSNFLNLNYQSLGMFVYETGFENLLKTLQNSIINFLNANFIMDQTANFSKNRTACLNLKSQFSNPKES